MPSEDDHKFISRVGKTKKFLKAMELEVSPETVERYTKLLIGISEDRESEKDISKGIFPSRKFSGMIIEKDIPIFSYCEHHVLPWFGQVHIGYISHERILGISKFTRLVGYYSSGLTIQEDVTAAITTYFESRISSDVIVVIEAIHTCKVARGVENPFSRSLTLDARGVFKSDTGPRVEFFSSIGSTRSQW